MENTAKNFALQLGSLVSLYIVIGSLIVLLFGVIEIVFPDAADYYWMYESATSSIRFSIALLVVFFPTYLVLTRTVNKIRRTEHGTYLGLTKWLIYLSLVVGGGILLGDLVAVLVSFLNGEITTRFILKALTFLIVVGAAFIYYLFDARNYWQDHEKRSLQYGGTAAVIVVCAIVVGYMHIETPSEVRGKKIDQEQISDLQTIQYRIEESYVRTGKLPDSLDTLFVGDTQPEASDERKAYSYKVLNESTFELCAEFIQPTTEGEQRRYPQPAMMHEGSGIKNPDNWDHVAGYECFERVMNTAPEQNQLMKGSLTI